VVGVQAIVKLGVAPVAVAEATPVEKPKQATAVELTEIVGLNGTVKVVLVLLEHKAPSVTIME
jgi:hypothetical protein